MKNIKLHDTAGRIFMCGLLVFIFSSSRTSFAQCPLSLSVSYIPVQQLSIADIDFDHFEARTLLFTLRIRNTGTESVHAKLSIALRIRLSDGTYQSDEAMTFKSRTFGIPAGETILTNLDIGQNGKIQKEEYNLGEEAKNKVRDVALGTGKFPAGLYQFDFSLTETSCGSDIVADGPVTFEFGNPSRIELRSPYDGETTNEFPLFEFAYDGGAAELTVAEILPGQSRDEAISREPAMNKVLLVGQNSFLYSGGRPLEQGKSYVWNVTGKIAGPGGSEVGVPSPIGLFSVSSTDRNAAENEILRILEEIFGPDYPSVFAQIHKDNFVPTGAFSLNGSGISQAELLRVLNNLRLIKEGVELSFE